MPNVADTLLSLAVPALVLFHLSAAPYSKVEESFNTQAIHDIITFGIPSPRDGNTANILRANYDHISFPGSVPRTFVGAAVLSGLASPFAGLLESPAQLQLLVRGILGIANALALVHLRSAVDVAFGRTAGRFYLAFMATQFHVIFYASRLLPNMLAFPLTTEALRAFLLSLSISPKSRQGGRRRRLALYLLAAAAIVFRSEVALLLATVSVILLLTSGLSIVDEVIPSMLAAFLIALPLTVGLDTFLWLPRISPTVAVRSGNRIRNIKLPLWPEAQAFFFNTVEGHASDWGTSPWHSYFTSALPKLLLNPATYLICIPAALSVPALRQISAKTLTATLLFPAIYSLLPHKEWRFIVYIVPALTAISAAGASYIHTRRRKAPIYRLTSLLILASIPISLLLSTTLLYTSALNYPGGHALALLHELSSTPSHPLSNFTLSTLQTRHRVRVHLDNLALQTGVTRFQELRRLDRWEYDKTDDPAVLHDVGFWAGLDLVVTENPELAIGAWDVVASVEGFEGVGFRLATEPVLEDKSGRGKVHREILMPPARLVLGEEQGAKVEDGLRRVAKGVLKGYWPHVKVRTRLFLLQRSNV